MQASNTRELQRWHHRLLPLLPVLIAVGAFIYMVNQHSRALKEETERDSLTQIALSLGMPVDATKADIYARLDAVTQDHEVARKLKIAEKVGLDVNWDRIFQRIERMQPKEREQALLLITSEYHLPGNMPIGGVKKNVSWRGTFARTNVPMKAPPHQNTMAQVLD